MQLLSISRHANRQDFVNSDWARRAERPHDPGLSAHGKQQAQQLGRRVAELPVDRIVSSPFLRAVETASIVSGVTNHTVDLEPGLGEWLNPDWFDSRPEILGAPELASRFAPLHLEHEACNHPEYPESEQGALSRIGATARCVTNRYANENLFLVSHGITVLGVLYGLVGTDVPDTGCPLASLTHLVERDGDWTIEMRNATSHLDSGPQDAGRVL